MRALFKPENGDVLLIKDADINESTLLHNFSEKIKNGASLEVEERNTGINDMVTGMVFTVKEAVDPSTIPNNISITSTVINSKLNLPLFEIDILPEDDNFIHFKVNECKWGVLKCTLESLGLSGATITSEGKIIAKNSGEDIITGSVTIPEGLFQFVNKEDASVNNFNSELEISLDGEPLPDEPVMVVVGDNLSNQNILLSFPTEFNDSVVSHDIITMGDSKIECVVSTVETKDIATLSEGVTEDTTDSTVEEPTEPTEPSEESTEPTIPEMIVDVNLSFGDNIITLYRISSKFGVLVNMSIFNISISGDMTVSSINESSMFYECIKVKKGE